jgi:two-component system OmpR family response regulator
VASGLVLVIEDDEWVSRLLSNAIRDAGYDVVACATAKEGFEMACSEEPSCIICDVELPDGDGFWVARSIRMQPSRVAVTPFIFLSGLDDPESRMEGYQVGGDIYITKPFRIQEVVAQIEALVLMAERMRKQHDTNHGTLPAESSAPDIPIDIDVVLAETPPPDVRSPRDRDRDRDREPAKDMAPTVTAIEGDLSQMSIATVLTVLEMERRTGIFEVVSKKRRAQLEIASGAVVQGTVGGTRVSALTTLRTMLGWTVGRFSFTPLPAREAPPNRKAIGAFLLEAVRLEDEAMRDELELPPSKRIPGGRLAAPALGGPASTADDLAPLSSKAASMAPPSVPSSTMPAMKAPQPSQPSIRDHARSEPPPPRAEPDPLPMSQAQPTLELDMEAISVQPTGHAPLFPGLAHITGTHRVAKPPTSPRVPPKQQPPPPPRAGSVNPPPPMPATGSPAPSPNAAAPYHVPPPPPKTTPVRPAGAPPPPPPRPRTETSGSVSPSTPPPPRPGPKPVTPATPPPLPTAARPVPPPLPKPENQPKKR